MSAIKVPEDIIQNWELGGNRVALISAYLQLADELTDAIYAAAGVDGNSPAADVAFIKDAEWEELVLSLKLNDAALSLLQRSRVRQFYATCQVAALTQEPLHEAEAEPAEEAPPAPGADLGAAAPPAQGAGHGTDEAAGKEETSGQPTTPVTTTTSPTTATAAKEI